MPPKRKSGGGARAAPTASQGQQSTLSFNGKSNKVTKRSASQDQKVSKKDPTFFEDVVRTDVKAEADPDIEEPTTAEIAIKRQAEKEAETLHESGSIEVEDVLGGRARESQIGAIGGKGSEWAGDEEQQARKIPETQIKRYWRQKESERLAPRVHQEDLGVHEKVLREWDMSGQYGPCIGIARLKRWKRANLLGLNPPIEVLAVLLKEMDSGDPTKSQRAHVDELMSSRFVET